MPCQTFSMKLCPRCNQILPFSSFASRGTGKGHVSYCRPCQSVYCKAHYRANKHKHNSRRSVRGYAAYRQRNREWVIEYLKAHPCVDCGEADIRVLEFDHVNREDKVAELGVMVGSGWSLRRITIEVSKCEVRCANCHRIRTVSQLGWFKSIGA